MLATFWLLGCVLGPAQPATRPVSAQPAYGSSASPTGRGPDWSLTPSLAKGQELVYRGTFHEESVGQGLRAQRDFRIESRFFVLDELPRGFDLAALTALRFKQEPPIVGLRRDPMPASVRLERLLLDPQGRISADASVALAVPLEGAPALEVGAFVEVPRGRLTPGLTWERSERGRPAQTWKYHGVEQANGQPCVKLTAAQQSADWDTPRADRGAWRRLDTVWISSRTGVTMKVERSIEARQPASREVSQRNTLRYDLESSLQYTARLAVDRRQESLLALSYQESARPMLAAPTKFTKQIAALTRKVESHLENNPPTPYRDAVLQVKRHLESAARGELVQVIHHEVESPQPTRAVSIGELAPDFVATEITGTGTARLARWKSQSKPMLLVFYHPNSYTAGDVLRFAEKVRQTHDKTALVIGLSVSDDQPAVLKQRTALQLGFPILHGGGVRISYGVTGTPKLLVIDGRGHVRGMYDGWGSETAEEVMTELRRWLPQ